LSAISSGVIVLRCGDSMETLALNAQKGGCGKSTLAVHMAVCAAMYGQRVALIDTHYVDTGGTSDHVFILCTMLGFRSVRSLPTRCRNFLQHPETVDTPLRV
jgi:hypothetical protein